MTHYIAQQNHNQPQTTPTSPPLITPPMIGLVGIGLALIITSMLDKRKKKGRLAKGFWGGVTEKTHAMKVALAQMANGDHDAVAVCLERPPSTQQVPNPSPLDVDKAQKQVPRPLSPEEIAEQKKIDPKKQSLKKSVHPPSLPIYLTDMNQGTIVIGSPGSGKSLLTGLPIIFSLLDQGLPLVVYDFKYAEEKYTPSFVGHAAKRGYDIHILAPGHQESSVCNALDFLPRDLSTEAGEFGQFATTLDLNFKKEGQEKGEDKFFATAGRAALQGTLMLAKESPFPDIMMCQAILSLPKLPQRIEANRERINFLTYMVFSTLIASANSEKQLAGILVTAANNLTQFMKPKILPTFCGKTTIPLDLKGKQLIVIGLDANLRDILAPLQATLVDLLITRNLAYPRDDGLGFINDEAPTFNVSRMVNWLNEGRSNGFVGVLLLQNLVQMERTYGKELTKAMITGCGTKVIYNPLEQDAAKMISDYLGEEEIHYKQRSYSRGKNGSTTVSEQDKTKALIAPSEITKFDFGERIIINRGFKRGKEAYIPIRDTGVFSYGLERTINESKALWPKIKQRLIERSQQQPITPEDLRKRYHAALAMLPLPDENSEAIADDAMNNLSQTLDHDL